MIPGSEEWLDARRGYPTGSMASRVLSMSRTYMRDLIEERKAGPQISRPAKISTPSLEWGNYNEALALAHYELVTGNRVQPSELVYHPDLVDDGEFYWRGTPDGFVEEDGLVEAKCPFNSDIHALTVQRGIVPREHIPQMEAYLGMKRRAWCDFISFDPRQEKFKDQIFIIRYHADPLLQAQLISCVRKFWAAVVAGELPPDPTTTIPELF